MKWYYPGAVALALGAFLTFTHEASHPPSDTFEVSRVQASRLRRVLPVVGWPPPSPMAITNCDEDVMIIDPQGHRLNGTTAPLMLGSRMQTAVFRAYIAWMGDQYMSMVELAPIAESDCP